MTTIMIPVIAVKVILIIMILLAWRNRQLGGGAMVWLLGPRILLGDLLYLKQHTVDTAGTPQGHRRDAAGTPCCRGRDEQLVGFTAAVVLSERSERKTLGGDTMWVLKSRV